MTTGPIPLVVAVTGHTDLRPCDTEALCDRVRHVFQQLRRSYPHSEVEVLSSLAEGADRLVARIALDLGLSLTVPLPMVADEYKKDFVDAASIGEFDALRARAARSFVVPGFDGRSPVRPECYARVGAYSVIHCHMLLALWNGLTTDRTGGTADVIRFRLEGVPRAYAGFVRLLDPIDSGVVHQIVTPRQSNPSTVGDPLTLQLLAPEQYASVGAAAEALEHICTNTDRFNAFAAKMARGPIARRVGREASLLSDEAASELPLELNAIQRLYGYADELAILFQRRTMRTLLGLFWITFGAIVAFEVFAHGIVPGPGPILAYVVLLSSAYGLYAWAALCEFDTKYLDYRALAEALRVQFYWRLAQVSTPVADYYMRYRLQEVEWIRNALRYCELLNAPTQSASGNSGADRTVLQLVVKEWAEGQRQYFVAATRRDQKRFDALEHRTAVLGWSSVVLGVAAMVLTLARGSSVWETMERDYPVGYFAIIAAIGLTSAAAALIHGYVEKRALSGHIKRYTRMTLLFQNAERALARPMAEGDSDGVREVLRELGREALEENADWVMLHRERPLEVPQ